MENGRKGNTILILDFGAQYAQLLALGAREAGAYSEVKPYNITPEEITAIGPVGMILSGGPESVLMENAPKPDPGIFKLGIPIMGVCYGHQLMAKMLGGLVVSSDREYGPTKIEINDMAGVGIFTDAGIKACHTVWMSHGDSVSLMPLGFRSIARTEKCAIAAMVDSERKFISFQFHPEVEHTDGGQHMIDYFVRKMCGAKCNWNMPDFIETAIQDIRETVGDYYVVGGISGGVDSTTAAVLVERAVGNKFHNIFVNNGLLRKNEPEEVCKALKNLGVNFSYVDAADRFLDKLKGVTNPDIKREIIGNEFIRVFEEEAHRIAGKLGIETMPFLVQGTIYPDVIESIPAHGGPTHKIKRHHNVGGLLKNMALRLIEPLRFLFKEEVRIIGRELGIPDEIIKRHPFPGPGEAIRCIGEITRERLRILKDADHIWIEELIKNGFYDRIGQAFVVLLLDKSVGVQGDTGSYEYAAALRSVDTKKFMTASRSRFPDDFLDHVVSRIIGEVKGINRVVYDLTPKPPGTIEWE